MSKIPALHQHVENVYFRLLELHQNASSSAVLSPDVLPIALKELGIVCEQLQIAVREFSQQTQRIEEARLAVESEQNRYQHFFEFSPDSYLIIDRAGLIQEANNMAANLFNMPQQFLIGKSLLSLAITENREQIQEQIAAAVQAPTTELTLELCRYPNQRFYASATLTTMIETPEQISLCCLLRDITHQQQTLLEQSEMEQGNGSYHYNCLYHYNRGEVIVLEPQTLWFVIQGAVKLTTLSERGEEILVGIVDRSMAFGSSLTSLPIYQATALSPVKLAAISLNDTAQYMQLMPTLLAVVTQRLQQTEHFLAIHGQIRVEDRLKQLLLLLSQSLGQEVETGTRLSIRLTHQDLADACCTTRVTITRLINRLQQEDQLEIDAQNHFILKAPLCQRAAG